MAQQQQRQTLSIAALEALLASEEDVPEEMFALVMQTLQTINEKMSAIATSFAEREAALVAATQELETREAQLQRYQQNYELIRATDSAANQKALANAEPLTPQQYNAMLSVVQHASLSPALSAFDARDGTVGGTTTVQAWKQQRQQSGEGASPSAYMRVCLRQPQQVNNKPLDNGMAVESNAVDADADALLICEQRIPLEFLLTR